MLNLRDRYSIKKRKPLLIAHRGGVLSPDTPENSLGAIRLAAHRGYDMVELDVREAKDHRSRRRQFDWCKVVVPS